MSPTWIKEVNRDCKKEDGNFEKANCNRKLIGK